MSPLEARQYVNERFASWESENNIIHPLGGEQLATLRGWMNQVLGELAQKGFYVFDDWSGQPIREVTNLTAVGGHVTFEFSS